MTDKELIAVGLVVISLLVALYVVSTSIGA